MSQHPDEAALHTFLADYLQTEIGLSAADIDFDVSMPELGVGSADAVVLSGVLSERLGRVRLTCGVLATPDD